MNLTTVAILIHHNFVLTLATTNEDHSLTIPNVLIIVAVLISASACDDATTGSQTPVFGVAYKFLFWNGLDLSTEQIHVWLVISFCFTELAFSAWLS